MNKVNEVIMKFDLNDDMKKWLTPLYHLKNI